VSWCVRARAAAAAFALALTPGWNVANVGAVADRAAHSYGVGLAVIGLFTTALFVTHATLQIPAGRLSDRLGPRLVGGTGLVVVAAASAAALSWRQAWFAVAMRLVAGVGTAAAFVAGSEYVRATSGSGVALGLYGASSMAGGGLALALVPVWGTWRAPFATAAAVAAAGAALVAAAPRVERQHEAARKLTTVVDRRLLPLGAMHAASFGLSVVIGNWSVTLLERAGGDSPDVAGVIAGLGLLLGVVTRPLGGRLVGRLRVVRVSLLTGGAGVALLAAAAPVSVAAAGAVVVGLAAGIPFAPAFAGAARLRTDAPGAAVGFVNMAAALTILAGTPLLGLSFSLPGDGRIGFAIVAVLWAATAAIVR
jgi:MFS transporter, NNP family, nitrate/nitrite transporter